MPIYNLDKNQQFNNIDRQPDFRSDEEKLDTPLSIYNHDSEDLAWAERAASELMNIAGAWITVYKRKRNAGNKDDVWEEDPDPTYKNGVKIKGRFVPQPAETMLSRWGADVKNLVTIHFSRANVIKLFGTEMIAEGDVLIVPHNTLSVTQTVDTREGIGNRIDRYRVIKSSDVGNFKYRWLYWAVIVQNLTGDITIEPENARDPV